MEIKTLYLNGLTMLITYTEHETESGCDYQQIERVQVGHMQMVDLPLDDSQDLERYHEMLGGMTYQQAMEWEEMA